MRNLLLLFLLLLNIGCVTKKRTLVLFGEKIKAKEVTGINKFNDLGTQVSTTVINDLTVDYSTVYWNLGTVRYDKNVYTEGSFSLFDLSNYNHKNGYYILDLIDFTYYEEVGFNLVEKKNSTILKNANYIKFKESFLKSNQQQKRELLWSDANSYFRELLFDSKYYKNIQKINNEVEKKFIRKFENNLDVNFDEAIKSLDLDLSAAANAKLKVLIKKFKEQKLKLNGNYISIIFQPRYIGIADYIIRGFKKEDLDTTNEFGNHLFKYINDTQQKDDKEKKFAFNSAIYGFQFAGNNDIVKIDSLQIRDSLNINLNKSIEIANKLNAEFDNYYNRTFKNEFNKFWLIMFATDAVFNKLKFKE